MNKKTKEDFMTVGLRFYVRGILYQVTNVKAGGMIWYNKVLDNGLLQEGYDTANLAEDLVTSSIVRLA